MALAEDLTNVANSFDCFVYLVDREKALASLANVQALTRNVHADVYKAAAHTNNQQLSSSGGTAGAVSPISQPETPFSVIADYGGITSSSKGSTATLQLAPDVPLARAYQSGLFNYCSPAFDVDCERGKALAALHRFSIGVNFDTSTSTGTVTGKAVAASSSGSQQPVTATTSSSGGASFSGVTAKYVVLWNNAGKVDFSNVRFVGDAVAINKLKTYLRTNKDYQSWQACLLQQVMSAYDDPDRANKVKQVVDSEYKWALLILLYGQPFPGCGAPAPAVPDTPPSNTEFEGFFLNAKRSETDLAADLAAAELKALKTAVLSVEYDHLSPPNQPAYSTYLLTGSCSFGLGIHRCAAPDKDSQKGGPSPEDREWTVTANAGAAVYDSTPSAAISGGSILRSVQAGLELDRNFPAPPRPLNWIGGTTLGGVYYYQDLTSPSVIKVTPGTPLTGISLTGLPSSATTVFGKKGPIQVAQARWGLGTGTKVKFPLAVSWSNRTELIAHHVWGVQFGISYDLSALVSNSAGGAQSSGASGGNKASTGQ